MYKVVYAEKNDLGLASLDLQKKVKHLENEGWIPQGGISVSTVRYGADTFYTFAQAMVKNEK